MTSLPAIRALLDCALEGEIPLSDVPWSVAEALSIDSADAELRMVISRCVLSACLVDGLVSLTVAPTWMGLRHPATEPELRSVYEDSSWLTIRDGPWGFVSLTEAGWRMLDHLAPGYYRQA